MQGIAGTAVAVNGGELAQLESELKIGFSCTDQYWDNIHVYIISETQNLLKINTVGTKLIYSDRRICNTSVWCECCRVMT